MFLFCFCLTCHFSVPLEPLYYTKKYIGIFIYFTILVTNTVVHEGIEVERRQVYTIFAVVILFFFGHCLRIGMNFYEIGLYYLIDEKTCRMKLSSYYFVFTTNFKTPSFSNYIYIYLIIPISDC